MKKFESFSKRLTRKVVFIVLVTMLIISIFLSLVSSARILVFSRTHYSDIMDKAQGNLAMVMSKVEVSADNIIDELSWHLSTPEIVISTLQYELNTNRHLKGCGLGFVPDYYPSQGRWFEPYALNADDSITVKDIGSESHDYHTSEWYMKAMGSPVGVWSNPYFDSDGAGALLCTYSRIVTDPDGKVAGVFGADISLDGVTNLIAEYIRFENRNSPYVKAGAEAKDLLITGFIIGPDGAYIAHPDTTRILKANYYDYAVGKGAEKYRELGKAMREGKTGERIVKMDGINYEVYFAPLLDSGWSMAIAVPIKRVLKPGFLFGAMIIAMILLGLLIVSLICRRHIKKTTKPLISLAESAQQVATGKFDVELPEIDTNDEICLLRDSFDNMQKSLSQYVDELKETTAQRAAMMSELDVARKIQMSMLPRIWPAFPSRDDLDIYGCVTPAKAVGGDLYDFRIRDNVLYFCIGDVSGKGVPASLVMTVMSSLFRTLSASEGNPALIVSSINNSMASRNDGMMFVTLFVGALDLKTGELQYCNAGHNAPFVISDGKAHMLEVDSNVPVGIQFGYKYSLQECKFSPHTTLFLYTDGLTEATRSDGQLFGEERVQECLSHYKESVLAKDQIAQMTEAVEEFVGDAEQSDDLTMLTIKYSFN
jgi:sigma-B regulation protein RsbU (phosphoserine phosphatase)